MAAVIVSSGRKLSSVHTRLRPRFESQLHRDLRPVPHQRVRREEQRGDVHRREGLGPPPVRRGAAQRVDVGARHQVPRGVGHLARHMQQRLARAHRAVEHVDRTGPVARRVGEVDRVVVGVDVAARPIYGARVRLQVVLRLGVILPLHPLIPLATRAAKLSY